jgi:hypothetical protein
MAAVFVSCECPLLRSLELYHSRQAEGSTGNPEPIQEWLVMLLIPDRALCARQE